LAQYHHAFCGVSTSLSRIKKDCEPLLLVPIGFGCILANIPLSDVMSQEGFIRAIYDAGITTELFPLLIFVGIGAMTDFGPVLAQPSTFLLGAAGQFGIFLTLLIALAPESVSRSMITSTPWMRNGLKCAARRIASRCAAVVMRIGSTDFMRNGSMIVFMGVPAVGLA
jgi:Na+-transporting methylmalonyl-CoA/oxaloacetate decarboxylase beta subunit